MPEGHTVHRSANQFNRAFKSRSLIVDSPQGRFAQSAELISGATLKSAFAVGKQLFLRFDNELTVRIHLGIYGKWRWYQLDEPEQLPEIRGEIRARFYGSDAKGKHRLAELRGPTACEVLNSTEVDQVLNRLGADPLNPDPDDSEYLRFETKVLKSSKTIGLLLMDQAVISGIGNVYRAELLFRARLSPHRRGKDLLPSQVRELWDDSVKLLEVGVRKGVMITRDEFLSKDPGKQHRNFVYKREGKPCRVCGTDVAIEIAAGRKLYWCTGCQA
ncbi:MAG: Fpg/Nei family DNA glycosylase [Micrococcales bacterium]